MEHEIKKVELQYNSKRQPILNAINQKRKEQQHFGKH